MSKIKSLLTINKSKDTLKEIETIGDLKQALEQDLMRSKEKEERKYSLIEFIITTIDITIVTVLPLVIVIITS